MSKFTIYTSNGAQRAVCDKLEYSGSWMGDCFLTVTVKSATPVDFHIGDYIVYRGETFTLNNDPSVLKKARRETYGEGFTYDNIKFSSRATELTDVRMLDLVLADNQIHYTSLPDFPFFAATIDDFADRLQANTNRWCESNGFGLSDYWLMLTPDYNRFIQRASCLRKDAQGQWEGLSQQEAAPIWEEYYGNDHSHPECAVDDEKKDVNVSVSSKSVWDMLAEVKNSFGLNFITRGRRVVIAAAGKEIPQMFEYGKGNGLYEIERTADTEQQVVTKLFSYGSEKNMPIRYYANLNGTCFGYMYSRSDLQNSRVSLLVPWSVLYMSGKIDAHDLYDVTVSFGSKTGTQYEVKAAGFEVGAQGMLFTIYPEYDGQLAGVTINADTKIYILHGVRIGKWKGQVDTDNNLPNNMAVNRLMLPGFPMMSLYDWVVKPSAEGGGGGTAIDSTHNNDNYAKARITFDSEEYVAFFSKEKYNPYILSVNFGELGVRESTKIFGGGEDDEIYPTIENTGADRIYSAEVITDNGVMDADDTDRISLFEITLPSIGQDFDLKEQAKSGVQDGGSPAIVMKSGYCGGREFKFGTDNIKHENGRWVVKCEREYDDLLQIYFPYSYGVSRGQAPQANEAYQVRGSDITGYDGDQYVLTGIPMTATYINAASKELLHQSLILLAKNDYTRYTYSPKVDEIFMAREHNENGASSLYSTIKEGDLMDFSDIDLDILGSVFIDTLVITEDGNNGIPTYQVTLRNDKSVGTIQRLQEKVDSIVSGAVTVVGGGSNGISAAQVNRLIDNAVSGKFLSKTDEDSAAEQIGFLKGLWVKAKGLFGIDGSGNAKVNGLTADGDMEVKGNGVFGGLLTALRSIINSVQSSNFTGHSATDTGWAITNDFTNGKSRLTVDELYVRARAIFEELIIKQKQVSGGDTIQSCAASHIVFVDYLKENPDTHEWEAMGYTTQKVPWTLNGVVRYLINGLRTQVLAKETATRRALTEAEMYEVGRIRCYFLASDGDRKIENWWRVGDLAYCKTLDLDSTAQQKRDEYCPTRTKQGNIEWWRKVEAVSSSTETRDGREYHWFDVMYDKDDEEEATGNLAWCKLHSDLPAGNDAAVQLGHTPPTELDPNATERMNAIAIEVNGAGNADTPCVKALYGIYTYDLTRCWFGGPAVRMCLSPKSGYKFYGPSFKFVQQYDEVRVPTDRGAYLDITPERDDYAPHDDNVRKCYFYDRVSYEGSLWLCLVSEGQHWVKNNGTEQNPQWDYISDEAYAQLDVEQQMLCRRVENYTKDIPSESSSNWEKQVSKGDKGESNLLLDMTNEMDSIACDASGIAQTPQSVSTIVRMFLGTQKQVLTSVSCAELLGGMVVQKSFSPDNKDCTITVRANYESGQILQRNELPITVETAAGTRQCVFTVNGIRPGAAGQAAVLYRLVPSVDEIKINKQGQYSVSSISVRQQKVVGATSSFEKECYMTVEIDGDGNEQQLGQKDYSATIGTASGNILPTSSITVRIYKTNTNDVYSDLQDVETIPVLIDGTDGKNSIRLTLDNEHEDFIYSDAGLVAPSGGATSQIRLYDGQEEKTYGTDFTATIDTTQSSGATASISNAGVLTVSGLTADSGEVVVKSEYPANSGEYYYAKFTANKTSQDKYDLRVMPSSIAFNASETWTNKIITLNADRTNLKGGVKKNVPISTSATLSAGNLYIFWGYVKANGKVYRPSATSTEGTDNLRATSHTVTPTEGRDYIGIYFELRYYTSGSEYRICDYETVEIAKTENGNNGNNGNDGNSEETVFIRTKSGTAPKIVDSGGDEKQSEYDNAGWYSSTHATHREEEFLPVAFVNTGSSSNPEIEANALSSGVGISGTPGRYGECTKSPKGVDETWKYEWEIRRTMTAPDSTGARSWNVFGNSQGESMSLRNKWASDGAPGDVYEVIAEDSAGGNVSLVSFAKDYANVVSASPAGYTIKLLKNGVVQSSLPSGYGWYWKRQGDNSWTSLGSYATYQRTSKTDFSNSGTYVEAVYYGIGTNASNVLYVKMVSMRWDVQRMLVPAGEWDSAETYIRTGNTTPLVHYHVEGVADYWYLDVDSSTGDEPKNTTSIWRICNDFEVVLTKMLFAEFARLGSFIVYGNYFISQYGTLVGQSSDIPVDATNVGTEYSKKIDIVLSGNNVNNGIVVCRVQFAASGVVSIRLTPSSESNCDFGAVGTLNSNLLASATASTIKSGTTPTLLKASGTTATSTSVSVNSGDYFYIAYAKDSSVSRNNDNATFVFSNVNFTISEIKKTSGTSWLGGQRTSVPYGWFDADDPMAETRPIVDWYKFRPMKCIDALTGEEWAAGGNVHFSETGNAEFSGILKAKELFHRICVHSGIDNPNGDNSKRYYPNGIYDGYGTTPNTGAADIVYHSAQSHGSQSENSPEIYLPDPATCQGKVVEIYSINYSSGAASDAVFKIGCVNSNAYSFILAAIWDFNKEEFDVMSIHQWATDIAFGEPTKFYATTITADNTNYPTWLKLM